MFLAEQDKPTLIEDQLYRLRLSLNTPVVETEDLPEGPARAALLVHFDPAVEGVTTTVGIRSLKDGTVVYYRYQAEISDNQPFEAALDAGLAFTEPMGFLFDEEEIEEVVPADQARALQLFWEMMGALETDGRDGLEEPTAEIALGEAVVDLQEPAAAPEGSVDTRASDETQTLNDETWELPKLPLGDSWELPESPPDEEAEPAVVFPAPAPAAEPEPPVQALTKFRMEPVAEVSEEVPKEPKEVAEEIPDEPKFGRRADDPKTNPTALGQLRLVKRRANLPKEAPQEPVNPLERLLGSF